MRSLWLLAQLVANHAGQLRLRSLPSRGHGHDVPHAHNRQICARTAEDTLVTCFRRKNENTAAFVSFILSQGGQSILARNGFDAPLLPRGRHEAQAASKSRLLPMSEALLRPCRPLTPTSRESDLNRRTTYVHVTLQSCPSDILMS